MSRAELDAAKREAQLLKSLRHPNIIKCVVHVCVYLHFFSDPLVSAQLRRVVLGAWQDVHCDGLRECQRETGSGSAGGPAHTTLSTTPLQADGGDLSQKVNALKRANKHLSEEEALDLFVQICLAIRHVHKRRIMHRDLKSQNVFLTSKGIVKVGDFGIAKQVRLGWRTL